MKIERKCEILEKKQLGDAIYMVLGVGDMVSTSDTRPGQFVHIKCGHSRLLRRPISICEWTGSRDGDTLAIVFEVRGEGTAWLARRQAGGPLPPDLKDDGEGVPRPAHGPGAHRDGPAQQLSLPA